MKLKKCHPLIICLMILLTEGLQIDKEEGYRHSDDSNLNEDSEHRRYRRIAGGAAVNPGDIPWQVYLRSDVNQCGGTIVDDKWILTAAHCLRSNPLNPKKKSKIWFDVGLHKERRFLTHVENHKADNILIHEEYNHYDHKNDIALVKLEKSIQFDNMYKGPLQLPEPTDDFTGMICKVSGWGRHSANDELHAVDIQVLANDICDSNYEKYDETKMLCAGKEGEGKDSCKGDSGGPLTCNGKLAGIVSFGRNCTAPPGVYVRVTSYLDWITNNKI